MGIIHPEIVLYIRWLLPYRQALKSSMKAYTQMVTGMLVSESLSTDTSQSSASVSCHEHCQVMFLCSSCLSGSVKDVSKSTCCAQNLILSWSFFNASCSVEVTLMMETSVFCHLAWIHQMSIYATYFFFIMNQIVSGLILIFSLE